MASEYAYVGLFFLVGVAFVVGTLIACWLFRPYKPSSEKYTTYECGEDPIGVAFSQYNVRYYIFALIFVLFDIEAIFLYPWALLFDKLGLFGFVEMFVFLIILVIGLVYAWRKGVLRWV